MRTAAWLALRKTKARPKKSSATLRGPPAPPFATPYSYAAKSGAIASSPTATPRGPGPASGGGSVEDGDARLLATHLAPVQVGHAAGQGGESGVREARGAELVAQRGGRRPSQHRLGQVPVGAVVAAHQAPEERQDAREVE